jgi:hypothetical protein
MNEVTTELGFPVDVAELLEQRGVYTAERLQARKPELVAAAKRLLGHGITAKMTSEILGIDIRAVLEIARIGEAEGAITPYKERTLRQLRAVITLALDSLIERAKKGAVSPIEVCALIDKAELLSGGATSRVEVVEDPETAEFRRFLQAQARGMGTGSPDSAQKGPAAAPALRPAAPGPLVDALYTESKDSQSSAESP